VQCHRKEKDTLGGGKECCSTFNDLRRTFLRRIRISCDHSTHGLKERKGKRRRRPVRKKISWETVRGDREEKAKKGGA